jgi:Tfp pilus assembly protein PilF
VSLALRSAAVGACLVLALLPGRLAVSQAYVEESIARMHAGDCTAARAEARRALELVDRRAIPHHVIAWCMLRAGDAKGAARELERALDQDPESWVLLESAAAARVAAGLDAGHLVQRAAEQNPHSALIHEVAKAARRENPGARARAGRRLSIPLPELGDP